MELLDGNHKIGDSHNMVRWRYKNDNATHSCQNLLMKRQAFQTLNATLKNQTRKLTINKLRTIIHSIVEIQIFN